MAVPPGMTKEERMRSFLRMAAVGDASHDFSGTRAGGNVFNAIFRNFKEIGTPDIRAVRNAVEQPVSEFEILNQIFPFAGLGETPNPETFRRNVLHSDYVDLGFFYRWAEDPIPYKVEAIKIATRPTKGEDPRRDYDWKLNSEQMFDFMKGNKKKLAFTIDATNLPFYSLLLKDKAVQNRIGYYIYMRESINDAATKTIIPETMDTTVRILTIDDTANYNVMYPLLLQDHLDQRTEMESFYSNYNLSVSAISSDKTPSVTLSIFDKQLVRQVQILKSRKEDAHPNAVPTLAAKIKEIATFLTPSGNLNKKMEYFSALQQKRSGDWLQVLGCLQPERFGLDASDRITIVTLDKICVAYALFAGIDVAMTYYMEEEHENSYWMIRMYKDYAVQPQSKEEQLKSSIRAFHEPDVLNSIIPANPSRLSFAAYKQLYHSLWNEQNEALKTKLMQEKQALSQYVGAQVQVRARFDINSFQNKIRDLLYAATTLAVFRNLAPLLLAPTDDESEIIYEQIQQLNNENYNNYATTFEIYKKNFMILYNSIVAKKGKATSTEQAINFYFTSIFNKNGTGTLANNTRKSLIDKLTIFGSVFSRANGGVNGAGIFSFLSAHLTKDETRDISQLVGSEILEKVIKPLNEEQKRTVPYQQFMNTFTFILGDYPTTESIPNVDLLNTIDAMYPDIVPINEAERIVPQGDTAESIVQLQAEHVHEQLIDITAAQIIGVDPQQVQVAAEHFREQDKVVQSSNNFQVTDFGVATSMLAQKYQLHASHDGYNLYEYIKTTGAIPAEPVPVAVFQGGASQFKTQNKMTRKSLSTRSKISRKSLSTRSKISRKSPKIKFPIGYIHNPLVTFYFLLRELSYRLSQNPDMYEIQNCQSLSNILISIIENPDMIKMTYASKVATSKIKSKTKTKINKNISVYGYMYYSSIETYLLTQWQSDTIMKLPKYFLQDIMNSVLFGYYNINPKKMYKMKERIILTEGELLDIFSQSSRHSSSDPITRNLKCMKKIIKITGEFDDKIKAASTTSSRKRSHSRTARTSKRHTKKFNFMRSLRPLEPLQHIPVQ